MQLELFERASKEALRANFSAFIRRTFATIDPAASYLHNWHIDLIAEYLEACRKGDMRRLIINMPPRMMKSTAVSVAWPAFILGHNPSARIMAASYSSYLAEKHSMDTRITVTSPWYRQLFPGVHLSNDQNEKHKFTTTKRGYRIATSVGGTVTGEGGNYLIVDDPLSAYQAMSAEKRDLANAWFEQGFATRLDDKKKGCIVLVMQRLHADDLSGFLLKKGGWEHLMLPAVAKEKTIYSIGNFYKEREAGEVLHMAREDEALIKWAKQEMGSYAFAAQYQQAPLSEEGGMVRLHWMKRYDDAPDSPERITQSWDTAIKAGAHNDASACLTFAEKEGVHYLIDVLVMRAEYPELKRAVAAHAEKFAPHLILIEDKASGHALIQDMKRELNLPVVAINPTGDKVTRLAVVSAWIEAGKVLFPRHATWLADFEAELFAFPRAPHDDQVDAMSQYLGWAKSKALHASLRVRRV